LNPVPWIFTAHPSRASRWYHRPPAEAAYGRPFQAGVSLQHVDRGCGQGRADDNLDAFDLVGPCATDRSLEHRLQGRRGSVMNDQQRGQVRRD
jgi:hypothetical protein